MFFFQHAFEWKAFTRDLLMGMPYCHLHFFYLIIGLYIIVPSISQAVIAMDEKHVRNAAVVACLISAVTFFWSVWTRGILAKWRQLLLGVLVILFFDIISIDKSPICPM
ncbi:hypothetical protein GO496_16445 [Acidovorax citrulli]|nr:hypothetical protein [Paracidovorax citrulli]